MPSLQDRQQVRSEELPEAAMTGPFGGIQSELPLTEIESLGFADVNNFMFRKGAAYNRPGWTTLPAFPSPANEAVVGVFFFYNSAGTLIQGVFTATRLLQFISGNWTVITGPAFHGAANQLFSWDVLNYKLCFSQGADSLFTWDGIAGSYVSVAGAPNHIQYLAEVGLHLVVVSKDFPNRYYWSGVGDPTDWTGFTSGLNDNVNNLGPINDVIKINQYGFGFHQDGILQIIPTGIGLAPFAFIPIANAAIGTTAPYSVAHIDDNGREIIGYLGQDNVYIFDGSSIEPIGDMPLNDGTRRRIGARSRILADIGLNNLNLITGFMTYAIGGQVFKAYWLNIPNVAMWVFNFDEYNWTRFTFAAALGIIGPFFNISLVRIMDLIGTIASQTWTPATLTSTLSYQGLLLGFSSGITAYLNFALPSELASSITSGKVIYMDRRHKHWTKKIRVSFIDLGPVTFTLNLTNEKGQSESHSFSLGNGSGDVLNYVQEYNLSGLRFQYTLSIPPGTLTAIVEIAPMYDTAGEQRGGTVEN
jgi:hypothetical protein